ncbi:MAG: ATP-binding protein [Polaromonas sp.]
MAYFSHRHPVRPRADVTRRTPPVGWLVGLLLWLGCASAFAATVTSEASSCDGVVMQQSAERTVRQAGRVIDVATVQLPDRIPREWRRHGFLLSYRLAVPACSDASVHRAILFSRVGGPYEVLSRDGQLDPVRSDIGSKAPYNGRIGGVFTFENTGADIEVRLLALPNVAGGLIRVAIGPQALLLAGPALPHYRWQQFNLVTSALMGLAGIVALAVWMGRRQDRQTLWFATACLVWGARGQLLQVFSIPIDVLLYEQINPLMMWFSALLIAGSTLWSISGMTPRRALWLRLLAVAGVIGFALSLLFPNGASVYRMTAFSLGFAVLGCMIWLLARKARQLRPAHAFWLSLGYCFVVIGATHDFMMILGVMDAGWWTLLTPGFTLLLLCHMVSVGLYMLNNLDRAEQVNEELEDAIQGKSQELQASYAQRQRLELVHASETARTGERERIMREMHDGLGAQLMTALRGMERGALGKEQIAQSLQDGLDELRLLMDSTDNTQPLQTALANWRNRWDGRLAATGLSLRWALDDELENIELPGDTVLQIMRVLQEAGANIVKHARADEVAVTALVRSEVDGSGRGLVLEITDDGIGLPAAEASRPGRGIRNMRQRARLIGATLELMPRPNGLQGTMVRLHLPLPSPAP